MRKILIAFLMFTLSGPAFIAPTPTFADEFNESTISKIAERLTQNQTARCENHKLYKLESVVGTGKTEQDAIDNWSQQAREYMKQYCLSNTPNAGTFDKKCGTGSGERYGQMIGYKCNEENTCENEKNQRNADGRTICQIEQSKNYTDQYVTGNYVSKHKKLVVRYDNSVGYFAVLEGSKYTPSSKDKFPGKNQQSGASVVTKSVASPTQPTASITGNVFDEDGEPATAYVYLQKGGEDLIGSNGSKVVSSTRFDNGAFEFSGYTWEQGYSLRINVMGQDMIINYSDHPDLNTPITFKLPEGENVNMIDQLDVVNTLSNKPCCVPDTCENCERNPQCSCTPDEYNQETCNNTDGIRDLVNSGHGPTCRPNKCIQPWFGIKLQSGTDGTHYYTCELYENKLDSPCKSEIKNFDPHATDGTIVEWDPTTDKKQCSSERCDKGWDKFYIQSYNSIIDGSKKTVQRCKQTDCPSNAHKPDDKNAKTFEASDWDDNGNATACKITECKQSAGWLPSKDGSRCVNPDQCESQCGHYWDYDEESCKTIADSDCTEYAQKKNPGVSKAHWKCQQQGKKEKSRCIIDECLDGWNKERNKKTGEYTCVNQLDCLNWGKENDLDKYKNATVASWDDDKHTKCKIMACDRMYRVDKNANACVLKNTEDQEKLQANLDKAKANEKSLENRITGAVGIGGVGIGGMMIGGALSERAADDYAESDMAAYINTFMCDYGDGNTVRGGQTNVEIPGGNELIDLYARYARLANDLKLRKESLGIKPGIESEVIIDKASTGLYDDVGTGVFGGGYASIARAIMNPTGADAQMWAAQRAATTSKLNTGIGIATTAAALTLGKTIADEFTKPKDAIQNAQQAIQEIPNKEPTCSDFDLEGTYPNCTCKEQNHKFVGGDIICQECGNGQQIVVDSNTGWQKCECPNGYWSARHNSCRQEFLTCEEQEFNTNNVPHLEVHMTSDGVCRFSCGTYNLIGDETDPNADHSCECPNDGEHQDTGEKCIQTQTINNENISIYEKRDLKLDSETFFAFSDHKLKDQNAKDVLTNFAKDIVDDSTVQSCIMIIYGHTDKAGDDASNERLAKRRIASVTDVFKKVDKFTDKVRIIEEPVGEKECKCAAQDDDHPTIPASDPFGACEGKNIGDTTFDKNYAPCRHVDIDVECKTNQLNKI